MNGTENFKINPDAFTSKSGGWLQKSRYIKPPRVRDVPYRMLKYEYAKQLAEDIEIEKNSCFFVIISGNFISGDLIEALIEKNLWRVKELTVSTLSMSQDNVDSLKNLLILGAVDRLNIIVSDYFFSHERNGLIKYIYSELDIGDRLQVASAGTHCKICNIETVCGLKIVIHGSANLRSSGNIEQLCIEESGILYDFNQGIFGQILEKYKTINHSIRRKELWQTVQAVK